MQCKKENISKIINKKIISLIICFVSLIFFVKPTIALAEGSDYSVIPLLPKSQLEETRSYYDFSLTKQDKVDLAFQIENLSEKEQTFSIDIYDAATNKNGIIDYSNTKLKENVKDDHRLSELVTIPDKVSVPAHSKKNVEFKIIPHKSNYKGYILGAVQIVPQKETKKSGITNLFTRTIAIRMWGSDSKEKINSKIIDDKNEFDVTTEKNTTLTYQLVNKAPKIEKEYEVQTILEKQDGEKKEINKEEKKIDFAPSSVLKRQISLKETLKDGKYKLLINTKTSEGENYNFEYNFNIKDGKLNQQDYWLYVLAFLALILMIIILFVLKKKKKEKEY